MFNRFRRHKEMLSQPVPEPEPVVEEVQVHDPTAWILENAMAEFLLMHTNEIKYMVMLGYTYLHGCKVFQNLSPKSPFSYRFINMLMACTGGGILVPIFINAIPVPLAQDAYPVAILISFLLHSYFPILREVVDLSPVFRAGLVVLFETMRAFVVTKLTAAAAAAIPASDFSFPIYGPIFCGTIAGCGGAFMPLNKGLDPIKENGLAPPMFSAFVGATFFHLFTQLAPSDILQVKPKASVMVALFFIAYGIYTNGIFSSSSSSTTTGKKNDTSETTPPTTTSISHSIPTPTRSSSLSAKKESGRNGHSAKGKKGK